MLMHDPAVPSRTPDPTLEVDDSPELVGLQRRAAGRGRQCFLLRSRHSLMALLMARLGTSLQRQRAWVIHIWHGLNCAMSWHVQRCSDAPQAKRTILQGCTYKSLGSRRLVIGLVTWAFSHS